MAGLFFDRKPYAGCELPSYLRSWMIYSMHRPRLFGRTTLPVLVQETIRLMIALGFLGAFADGTIAQTSQRTSQRRLPKGFLSKTFKMPDGSERKYALFIPPQYNLNPAHKWPVIVFLHGSAECGKDGIRHTTVGLPVYVSQHTERFPFIVLMPQAQEMWFRGKEAAAVWGMLDEVTTEYRTDHDRIYLTGLSMGGFGTWELSVIRPDAFAAIVPVCGAAPVEYLSNIVNLPIWAFHGALDKNVSVNGSRDAINALKKLGSAPKYTEFPKLQHICWDEAYATPDLWRWLLQQRKKPPPRVIDYYFPGGMSRVWWLVVESDEASKKPVHVRAEVGDGGQVTITSQGVVGWGLLSDAEPLMPGQNIEVSWNGKTVYKGAFSGRLTLEPEKPTTRSAKRKRGSSRPKPQG